MEELLSRVAGALTGIKPSEMNHREKKIAQLLVDHGFASWLGDSGETILFLTLPPRFVEVP